MKKIILSTLLLLVIIVIPSTTFARENYKLMESIPFIGTAGIETVTFPKYLLGIFKFIIASVIVGSLLMITIGGYLYIVSAGNQARSGHAKEIIWNALTGLVIALFVGILFLTINPDIMTFNPVNPKKIIGQAPSSLGSFFPPPGGKERVATSGGGNDTTAKPAPVSLPSGCDSYKATFNSASGGDKVFGCLLYGIGTQESSGCKPNMESPVGACGIMQFMPSTGAKYGLGTCAALKSNPEKSIKMAAKLFNHHRGILAKYSFTDATVGLSNSQSGTAVTVGPYTYDNGNDDLIASYNAGAGTKSGSGKKGPFAKSSDCPGKPVWQCNINDNGRKGFKETRNYVRAVQAYQKMCLDQNKL